MIFTTVTVQANGAPAPLATGVEVQIDQVTLDMSQFDKGASPYDLFNVFVKYCPVRIKRNNHLIDENDGTRYTVSARVETFPDGRQETQAMVPVGS